MASLLCTVNNPMVAHFVDEQLRDEHVMDQQVIHEQDTKAMFEHASRKVHIPLDYLASFRISFPTARASSLLDPSTE